MKNAPEFSTTIQMYKFNDKLNSYSYDKFETDRVIQLYFLIEFLICLNDYLIFRSFLFILLYNYSDHIGER